MPIIPRIARRHWKVRAAVVLVYSLLVAGGTTMVYPFMVMVTGSLANRYDYGKFQVLPTAMWREHELIWKFMFDRYDFERFSTFATVYRLGPEVPTWEAISADPDAARRYFGDAEGLLERAPKAARRRVADWHAVLDTIPPDRFIPLHEEMSEEAFQAFLQEKYSRLATSGEGAAAEAAMQALSREWGVTFEGFHEVRLFYEATHVPVWYPAFEQPRYQDLLAFKQTLPAGRRLPLLATALWHRYLAAIGSVKRLNELWGTEFASRYEIPFSFNAPPIETARETWTAFLQKGYPRRLTRLKLGAEERHQATFQRALREEFRTVPALNTAAGTTFTGFDDVRLTRDVPASNKVLRLRWMRFLGGQVPVADLEFWSAETEYRTALRRRYGDLAALNAAHSADYTRWGEVMPPILLDDYLQFEAAMPWYRFKAPLDNYRRVLAFVTTKGYALRNTVILVALSVLAALTVNPMAAYALSRYSLRSSHRVLIFLLATMAFPHEVTMIPNFLMLRDLGLLNTFGALVLPRLANGFSIFLLKGFFDSLPRELYEAAAIDGASEARTFLTITLPMTKPILAVIALNVFVQVYSSFMWAFVVCQKESMWTFMVWLYQFQQHNAVDRPHLVMASICLACIPTLIMFLLCQRVILRGIVVPQMK